jgi:hypothetical protein
VARDLSQRRLEERFDVAYPEREPPTPAVERADKALSPAVAQVRRALDEHERVTAVRNERTRAEEDLAAARKRLQRLDQATERVRRASQRFDATLARVYREPAAALARFSSTSIEMGAERAVALLQGEPERFGPLKTVERRRALGLGIAHDDRQARLAGPSAAARAQELAEAQHALSELGRGQVDAAATHLERTGM